MADGYQVIPAPPATPPRLGLLASAQRPDTAGRRWEGGIRLHPQKGKGTAALSGGAWWDGCPAGDAITDAGTTTGGWPGNKTTGPMCLDDVDYLPWQDVEAETRPGTAFGPDEYEAQARLRLVNNESNKVEREFWLGEVAQAAAAPNNYLTKAAAFTDLGTWPLVYALAQLQQHIASTISGRGMIHCTPYLYTLWTSAQVVRREGNLVLDGLDNIVVVGTGYTGDNPNGGAVTPGLTEWAFCTGMVQFLDGDINVPGSYNENLNRSTNIVTLRAERLVAAFHDNQCQAGVIVNMGHPCVPS